MAQRLTDDGNTVVVDLHGYTVDPAIDAVFRLVDAATERGRVSVRIIHGSSTTDREYANRTIKSELHRLIRENRFEIVSSFFADDYMILGLPLPSTIDRSSIRSVDIFL